APTAGTGGGGPPPGGSGVAADGGGGKPSPSPAPAPTPGPSAGGPGVVTRGYDAGRTGANLGEKALTPAAIGGGSFAKLYCRPVDDEIYGQMLYVPGVDMAARGKHDTLYVVTMKVIVYALAALDGAAAPLCAK